MVQRTESFIADSAGKGVLDLDGKGVFDPLAQCPIEQDIEQQ